MRTFLSLRVDYLVMAEEAQAKKSQIKGHVNITEPMVLWILLLLIAVAINIIIANFRTVSTASAVYTAANAYANFVLNLPGFAILPLIIGAIIGAEIGSRSLSLKRATVSGLLNGIYASVIYAIAIVILYLVLDYGTMHAFSSGMLVDAIIIPIIVFLITIEVFSVLSFSRKVDL